MNYDDRQNEWIEQQGRVREKLPPWIQDALLKRPEKEAHDDATRALRRIEMILLQMAVGLFPAEHSDADVR